MLTVIPIWHTCFTCISRSRRGFFSMAPSTVSMLATLWLVRVLGEWGDPARCVFPPPGDRICDKISRKSSLKERARRASFPPRGFVFGVVLLSDSATPTHISHKLYDSISKWPTPPLSLHSFKKRAVYTALLNKFRITGLFNKLDSLACL